MSQNKRRLGRTCACGASIVDRNASGRCKPCTLKRIHTSDELREKIRQGVQRYYAHPVHRAHQAKLRSEAQRRARASNPEAWAERDRANLRYTRTPEAEAKRIAAIKVAWAKKKMSWCPVEYRSDYGDFYRNLIKSKGIRYQEARRIVLDEIARREAKLSPFERQDRAMQRGAALYEAMPRATLDRPGVYRP